MKSSFDPFVLPVLGLGLIALIVAVRLVAVLIRRRAWSELAERTGLAFTPGNFLGRGMSVSGLYRSVPLRLDTFVFRSGRSSSTYTRIVLPAAGAPPDLVLWIYTEGVFSRLGKLLGMKDIQTGDEELDKRFLIRGKPEGEVVRLLRSAGPRQALLAAPALQLKLENGEINLQKQGIIIRAEPLIALFDLLVAIGSEAERMMSDSSETGGGRK